MRAMLACFFLATAFEAVTGTPARADERPGTAITEIRQENSARATRLVVDCTGPVAYTYYSPDPLTLVVDIRVVEVLRGGVLWKESGLSETASFFSGTDAQYTEANRRVAFEEVARRMAVRLSQTLRVLL